MLVTRLGLCQDDLLTGPASKHLLFFLEITSCYATKFFDQTTSLSGEHSRRSILFPREDKPAASVEGYPVYAFRMSPQYGQCIPARPRLLLAS